MSVSGSLSVSPILVVITSIVINSSISICGFEYNSFNCYTSFPNKVFTSFLVFWSISSSAKTAVATSLKLLVITGE